MLKRQTSVYRKPTDSYSYLHPSSAHPPHTKKAIVYSQGLRYNRLCSDSNTLNNQIGELSNAFTNLGYNPKTVQKELDRAKNVPRQDLLTYRERDTNERIPLVLTFNSELSSIKHIAKDLQQILDNDPTLKHIFPKPPMIAYRQTPNLRRILVRSKFSSNGPTGTFPCNKPRCKLCNLIDDNGNIPIPNSQEIFRPSGHFKCSSSSVVYMIRCDICPDTIYIGETGQSLRNRMNGHKQTIRNKNLFVPVGEHFNKEGHSISDMRITVLQGHLRNTTQRRICEQKLIAKFDCLHNGLNRDMGFLSHYTQ